MLDWLPELRGEEMNKQELIDQAAARLDGVTKKDIAAVLAVAIDLVQETVAAGDKVVLVGFGSFESRQRTAREGRNPRTGESIQIDAVRVPAFVAGKLFRQRVRDGAVVDSPAADQPTADQPKRGRRKKS